MTADNHFWIEVFAVCAAGYLLGSINFAVIIGRLYGIDILKKGSCNPGATNVKRLLGSKAGNAVFILDFIKGLATTGWPLLPAFQTTHPLSLAILGLVCCVLGHSFSIFLKFKGGKGVSCAMGGLAALMPWTLVVGLALWAAVFYMTRYVSLASISFAISLPISAIALRLHSEQIFFALALALFIVARHRENVMRLLRGKEPKFIKKQMH